MQQRHADLGLESRVGCSAHEILGEGAESFYQCQYEILMTLCNKENIVVTTDASVVCTDKLCTLLRSEFVVNLKVSTKIQLERTSVQDEFLLSKYSRQDLFEKLHMERDSLYEHVAHMQIDSDNSAIEEHVASIMKNISNVDDVKKK